MNKNAIKSSILDELDAYWSKRMTELVDQDRISDADALFSEYIIDGEEPDKWLFIENIAKN